MKGGKNNNNNQNTKVVKKSNPPQQQKKQQPQQQKVATSKQQPTKQQPAKQQSAKPQPTKQQPTKQQPAKPQPKSKQEQIQPKKVLKQPTEEEIDEEIDEENEDLKTKSPLAGIDAELFEEISNLQIEIDNISNKEMQHKLKLDIERDRALLPLYNEREKILLSIPNFWSRVISNHQIISALITDKDQDLLSNLTNFKVDIMESGNVRFNFTFKNNNFIKNKTIWKEYAFDDQGVQTTCSPIQWKNGNDITKKKQGEEPSFFSWFADQDDLEIFDILKHEIWMFPNSLYN